MLSNCGRATILIVLVLGLGACGGGGNGPAELVAPGADYAGPAAPPDQGAPSLPDDAYVDPALIIERRGSKAVVREVHGAETHAAAANTTVDGTVLELTPDGNPAGTWAVYAFSDLTHLDYPLELTLRFDPRQDPPPPYYMGFSDYTNYTWHWVEVAIPACTETIPVPQEIDTISPGGNLYTAIVMTVAETTRLAQVDLELDSYYLPAPTGLSASRGTDEDAIHLNWDNMIERFPGIQYDSVVIESAMSPSGPWEEVGSVPDRTYEFTHEFAPGEAQPLALVYYRLSTVYGEHHGSPSQIEKGWLGLQAVEYLQVSDVLMDRFEIYWSPVEMAGSYQLEYRYGMAEVYTWIPLVEVDALSGTQYIHTADNPPGQTSFGYRYYYRVRAMAGASTSGGWSPVDSGYRPNSVNFTATDGTSPTEISLTWTGNNLHDAYVIEYRNISGGSPGDWTILDEVPYNWSNELFHTDNGPTGKEAAYGQVYEYRVFGKLGGDLLNDVLGEDSGFRAIGDVTGLVATQNDAERIGLSWEPVALTESYLIEYRNLDGGGPTDWTTLTEPGQETTAFDHTSTAPVGREAAADDLYEYRAKARWSGETSPNWSESVTGAMRFGNVTGFSATDGLYSDRTVLTWAQMPQADAYEIEYRNLDGGTPLNWTALVEINDLAVTSFDHTLSEPAGKGCVALDHYEYRIRSRWGEAFSPDWTLDTGYCGAGPGDWFMDGRGRKNQRRSPHAGPETPDLLWSYIPGTSSSYGPVSSGADGTLYFCGGHGNLYALNPDGSLRWEYDGLHCGYTVTPCIGDDGTIYCTGLDYQGYLGRGFYLHAIDPAGSLIWMQFAGYTSGSYSHTASPVTTESGNVVWAHCPFYLPYIGRMYMTGSDGVTHWAYDDSCGILSTPAIDDSGRIYGTFSDSHIDAGYWSPTFNLHAINPDGSQAWCGSEFDQGFGPSIGDDGRIYVILGSGSDSNLYCYEAGGTLAWTLYFPVNGISGLAIGADGCIYTGFLTNSSVAYSNMYAVNPDGSIRWTYQQTKSTSNNSCGAPAIDGNGTIYGGGPGGLHAINPDGTQKWLFSSTAYLMFSPTIGNDGTVFFPAGNTIYAIGPGVS